VDPSNNSVDSLEEPVTLTRVGGGQTVTVPDDSRPSPFLLADTEPLLAARSVGLAHAGTAEPLVPAAAGTPVAGSLEAVASQPARVAPARPKFMFDFAPTTYRDTAVAATPVAAAPRIEAPLEAVAARVAPGGPAVATAAPVAVAPAPVTVEAPLEEVAKRAPAAVAPVASVAPAPLAPVAPVPLTVEAPLEEVAKRAAPAPAAPAAVVPAAAGTVTREVLKMPTVSTTPVTKVSADGESKTVEDADSVTTVKAVKKPKAEEADTSVTVDEDESDERVIEKIEKKAGKKLNDHEKKKALGVIKMKK